MRTVPSSLTAFLNSKQPFWSADLFTFALVNGTTNYWTSADQDIVSNGIRYSSLGPALTRTRWNVKNVIDVPEMEIKLLSTGSDYAGTNIKLLIHNGLLDGASISLQRVFMPTFGDTSAGAVLLFGGKTSTVSLGALGATITVKGINVLLQKYMPRNTFQLSCIHSLYDQGCTLNRASFTFSETIGAGSTNVNIAFGTARTDGARFSLGYCTMTSGAAEGEVRTISTSSNLSFSFFYPLYNTPALGDTMTVTYGCAKNQTVCAAFSNTQNYRGFPYIPPPETAY